MAAVSQTDIPFKKRLDTLEAELQQLQETVLIKKESKGNLKLNDISALVSRRAIGNRQTAGYDRRAQGDRPEPDWFACLQTITKSIEKGTDAIKKIASLTEVSSLTEGMLTSDQQMVNKGPRQTQPALVASDPMLNECKKKWNGQLTVHARKFSTSFSEGSTTNVNSATACVSTETSSTSAVKGMVACKKQLLAENSGLKKQLNNFKSLKFELGVLRKKLKNETKRRMGAEKKIEKLEEATLKGEINGKKIECLNELEAIANPKYNANSTNYEKMYIEEKRKRDELEKKYFNIKAKFDQNEKTYAGLSDSRNLAVAMAGQFRERMEKYNFSQGDTQDTSCDEVDPTSNHFLLYKTYRERALKAEQQLEHLESKIRNPMEAPEVVLALEKHARAYSELLLAKKCASAQYKARCESLEEEMNKLRAQHQAKTKTLMTKVRNLTNRLKEGQVAVMNDDKGEVDDLKKTIVDLKMQRNQQEELIQSLKETISGKEVHIDSLKKDLDASCKECSDLRHKAGEFSNQLKTLSDFADKLQKDLSLKIDTVSIQEKMLYDHADTIKTLRGGMEKTKKEMAEALANNENLRRQIHDLQMENTSLKENVEQLEEAMRETEKHKENQKKNLHLLQQLEAQVYDRHKEWETQLTQMYHEKEQAVQTAKFATRKLMQAVTEHEAKIEAHEQFQRLLNDTIADKEEKLQNAVHQLNTLKAEILKLKQKSKLRQTDLERQLRDACRVCTDVLDDFPMTTTDGESYYHS